jgi:hypothetical protein
MRKLNSMLFREQLHIAFKEKYREIEIVQRQTTALKIDFDTEQISRMINGNEPTICRMSWTTLPVYRNLKLISEIDREVAEPYLSQLKPFFINRCMTGKRLFMLPASWTGTCMVYNRKLFSKAGLDPGECFCSLESFIETLRRLKKMSGNAPLMFYSGVELYFWLQHLVVAFSEPLEPGSQVQSIDWNSDAALNALACFHQLFFVEKLVGCAEMSQDEISMAILTDQIPLFFDFGKWSGMLMGISQTARFGIECFPGKGGRLISIGSIDGWTINAKASPEERLAGLRYALYHEQWIHCGSGGKSKIHLKDFPKPWQIYKDPASDRFLTENCEFPLEWQRQTDLIEKEMVMEPFCNEWEKYTHGDQLLAIGRSAMTITPEILRLCLVSLNGQRHQENAYVALTENALCS